METKEWCYNTQKKLNCYVVYPSVNMKPTTMVVIVHGGAWMLGTKDSFHAMAKEICHNYGAICVVPDYSLSNIDVTTLFQSKVTLTILLLETLFLFCCKRSQKRYLILMMFLVVFVLVFFLGLMEFYLSYRRRENSHPTHVYDVGMCMEFVAKTHFVNTPKIVLIGHSAGAHICSLLALNEMYLEKKLFNQIKGVIAISGVYSYWDMKNSYAASFVNKYVFVGMFDTAYDKESLEKLRETDYDKWHRIQNAWPNFNVSTTQHKVPFLLLTSDTDFSILNHSVHFAQELQKNHFVVKHIHAPNSTHFSIHKHWFGKHEHIFNHVKNFLQFI